MDMIKAEVEKKRAENNKLEYCLADNVTVHHRCEDRVCAGIWPLVKEGICG
jgi:hypothetical protein